MHISHSRKFTDRFLRFLRMIASTIKSELLKRRERRPRDPGLEAGRGPAS